jgi:hypothetical protein
MEAFKNCVCGAVLIFHYVDVVGKKGIKSGELLRIRIYLDNTYNSEGIS